MSSNALPLISSRRVKEVDSLTRERFGIPVEWLMEAAGWQIARHCPERAIVVCGVGNNAGDGLAAARHLHRWGRLGAVCCIDGSRLRGDAARELQALLQVGVEVSDTLRLEGDAVVVDAIFGTGLSRAPAGPFADWIEAINASGRKVLAVDVPSGLDADTGVAYSPSVRADVTVTLGLPKPGLSQLGGQVIVVDIGIPFEAYAAVGVDVPPDMFSAADYIRL